jgi:hypothetical protein
MIIRNSFRIILILNGLRRQVLSCLSMQPRRKNASFSLKDIIVMLKFIEVMKAQELYILRDKILNCFTEPYESSFDYLLRFDEDTTISEKKPIRDLMNKVIFEHVEIIAAYVKKYDTDQENMAMKNLLEFALYANEQEKLSHGKLIWEIMREIARKIPQDPDNPFAPIEAKKTQ